MESQLQTNVHRSKSIRTENERKKKHENKKFSRRRPASVRFIPLYTWFL